MEIRRGVLRGFNAGSYTATVQVAGSIATWLTGVAVARNIGAAEMVEGRSLAIIQFDESNPGDMVVAAVWEA
jgi:hypothetical protein